MDVYKFIGEIRDIGNGRCRIIIPKDVTAKFKADTWFVEEMKVEGKVFKNLTISSNAKRYLYILLNEDLGKPDGTFVDVQITV